MIAIYTLIVIKQLSHVSISTKSIDKVKKFCINILAIKTIHKFIKKNNNEFYGLFFDFKNKTFLKFFK